MLTSNRSATAAAVSRRREGPGSLTTFLPACEEESDQRPYGLAGGQERLEKIWGRRMPYAFRGSGWGGWTETMPNHPRCVLGGI